MSPRRLGYHRNCRDRDIDIAARVLAAADQAMTQARPQRPALGADRTRADATGLPVARRSVCPQLEACPSYSALADTSLRWTARAALGDGGCQQTAAEIGLVQPRARS